MQIQSYVFWPRSTREPRAAEANLAICCEILPVTLVAGQIVYLRRHSDVAGEAWHEPLTSTHPSETVRSQVEAFLGVSLDPGASVVHSTAWRYECSGGAGRRLFLTYLVALAPHFGQALSRHTRPMILQAVGTEQPARSEALMPPAQILLEQVISHALDHLALLMKTDTAIQLALGEVWHSALHYRQQRPAGELREA